MLHATWHKAMQLYRLMRALAALCILVTTTSGAASTYDSVYTDIQEHRCKLLSVQVEGANSVQSCPGVGGYRLLVVNSDSRMSVTVIDPTGHKMPLDFWTVVTKGFSSLGPRAEWRIARVGKSVVPVALIVRVNVSGETVTVTATSYLVVTKISGEQSCVVARIPSAATSNADARKAADAAAAMSCLTQVE